jgi:hypothetical protein
VLADLDLHWSHIRKNAYICRKALTLFSVDMAFISMSDQDRSRLDCTSMWSNLDLQKVISDQEILIMDKNSHLHNYRPLHIDPQKGK